MGREDGGGKARVGLGRTGTRDWLVTLGGGGFALRSLGQPVRFLQLPWL